MAQQVVLSTQYAGKLSESHFLITAASDRANLGGSAERRWTCSQAGSNDNCNSSECLWRIACFLHSPSVYTLLQAPQLPSFCEKDDDVKNLPLIS